MRAIKIAVFCALLSSSFTGLAEYTIDFSKKYVALEKSGQVSGTFSLPGKAVIGDVTATGGCTATASGNTVNVTMGSTPGEITVKVNWTYSDPNKGSCPKTATGTFTAVGVKNIEITENGAQNDVTGKSITVIKGTKYTFTAKPDPSAASWPSTYPKWEGKGIDISAATGNKIDASFPTQGNDNTLTAKCSGTGSDAEMKDVMIAIIKPEVTKISWVDSHRLMRHEDYTEIANPVWEKTYDGEVTRNYPGAYTMGKNASAKLSITAPTAATYKTGVYIRGKRANNDGLEFTAEEVVFSDWSQSPTLKSTKLKATVNLYDTLDTTWQYRLKADKIGDEWIDLNTSSQILYTTLNKPSSTPVFVKILDLTCNWAKGEKSSTSVFSQVWSKISAQSTGYSYYGDSAYGSDTRGLLLNQNGDCDAWADFMVSCCAAHGISASKTIFGRAYAPIIVKNVIYGDEYVAGPPRQTFFFSDPPGVKGINFTPVGIAGQGMATPSAKEFNYHAVVKKGNVYYDPSYMTKYASERFFLNGLAGRRIIKDFLKWQGKTYFAVSLVEEPPFK